MSLATYIAKRETSAFFSSLVALLFILAFLLTNLFTFFWVEAFFARNIADIRPLFEWMPLLLIFLVGALTMRMWSEERKAGTIEFLLTLPVSNLQLVLGKFYSCMTLVTIALALTLPIPITVSFLGDLDWGPVCTAYIATLFLAAAYTSIGLFISAKTDNQIVSLILTVAACYLLYLIGSDALTPLVGNNTSELLRLFGTGSRFESIARGVIDIRDIYYYLSIVGIFLTLNVVSLEKLRWSEQTESKTHSLWKTVSLLFLINFFLGNVWLSYISSARIDVTENQIYSISQATESYIDQLQEPLLIRGYFSGKTHPLLAPLVPQIRDLILEYETVSNGKIRAEFLDPRDNPELEEEASKKYGIKPVPFQISGKYEASLVNSYFDVLIAYGDKYEVLNFQDLIEVQVQGESDIQVTLRNPEYDITRTMKKVLYGFQTRENLFSSLKSPVTFTGYISEDAKLPGALRTFKRDLTDLLGTLAKESGEKLSVKFEDPEAGDGALAKEIETLYGLRPMAASLFSQNTFYFYTLIKSNKRSVLIPLPEDLTKEGAERAIDAALKRFSSGFLKTVAVSLPVSAPPNPYAPQAGGKQFNLLREKLSENYTLENAGLSSGSVSEESDLLLVGAPNNLGEKELFAVDQFLMKGGTVVLFTSPFSIARTREDLSAKEQTSGLEEWLKHNGITIEKQLVLDPRNQPYPIPVKRNLGGFAVQEIQMVPYPYFADIRGDDLNQDTILTSGLPQIVMNWSSPITTSFPDGSTLQETVLLRSSSDAWLSDSKKIIPNFQYFPRTGFAIGDPNQSKLGIVVEGEFTSYFNNKENPLLKGAEKTEKEESSQTDNDEEKKEEQIISGIINKSPESGRIILFSSNEFIEDQTLQISASTGGNQFLHSLQIIENALDWSLEDRGLLSIRSRGHFSRTLLPMNKKQQMFWEYLNYIITLIALIGLFLVYRGIKRTKTKYFQQILSQGEAS